MERFAPGPKPDANDGQQPKTRARRIHQENCPARPKSVICQTMTGVVLARAGERNQTTPQARDGNESGIENGHAENKNGHEPSRGPRGRGYAQLERQCGHQKTQKHRPAITHEHFRRVEVPSQESKGGAKDRRRQRADQHLTVEHGQNGDKKRGDGGDARA